MREGGTGKATLDWHALLLPHCFLPARTPSSLPLPTRSTSGPTCSLGRGPSPLYVALNYLSNYNLPSLMNFFGANLLAKLGHVESVLLFTRFRNSYCFYCVA